MGGRKVRAFSRASRRVARRAGGCDRDRRNACDVGGQERDIDGACCHDRGRRSGRHRHCVEPGALLILADRVFLHNRKRMMDFATEQRLPSVNAYREVVEAGGLMSYGPSYEDMHRRAADYVDKILKGAKPGDLPVEQPTKFTLVINLKSAKAIGLDVPPMLLGRADEVIE